MTTKEIMDAVNPFYHQLPGFPPGKDEVKPLLTKLMMGYAARTHSTATRSLRKTTRVGGAYTSTIGRNDRSCQYMSGNVDKDYKKKFMDCFTDNEEEMAISGSQLTALSGQDCIIYRSGFGIKQNKILPLILLLLIHQKWIAEGILQNKSPWAREIIDISE